MKSVKNTDTKTKKVITKEQRATWYKLKIDKDEKEKMNAEREAWSNDILDATYAQGEKHD